mmetsp:Transcript_14667/g.59910  ORF Transcript_14667/g.59910 Transcript_14667/m.59910 type:complete len:107 (+) Transcript_14667:3867-4187(+)
MRTESAGKFSGGASDRGSSNRRRDRCEARVRIDSGSFDVSLTRGGRRFGVRSSLSRRKRIFQLLIKNVIKRRTSDGLSFDDEWSRRMVRFEGWRGMAREQRLGSGQ